MSPYFHNDGLFARSYFERVLADPRFPRERSLPADGVARLRALRALWESVRGQFVKDARTDRREPSHLFAGLPPHLVPLRGLAESQVDKLFIEPVCETILGYAISKNPTLALTGLPPGEYSPPQRPDLVLFTDTATRDRVVQKVGGDKAGAPDGVKFCRSAALIVDAKRFNKGVGADETTEAISKKARIEPTAIDDIAKVSLYLRGYDRPWGVLTNGRCWRLMRQGKLNEHLRFDLVLFLENQRGREPTDDDVATFTLFWSLFGSPAVAGGYLDALERESADSIKRVREALRERSHTAVEEIARGFWSCANNAEEGLTTAPTLPFQIELDHLRELSLTLLYRLLFILKAEAQNLLPMRDELGADTGYARMRSSRAIFAALNAVPENARDQCFATYDNLCSLFDAIDRGDAQFKVPAYNGGLFGMHPELARWRLSDRALHRVLQRLIYLENSTEPVPYADLHVRDLGDIYEGLLDQRLTGRPGDPPTLYLRNQKGERKASGSYFTPDGLVEHLVRRALGPLLEAAGSDATRALALRVLDPGMGSGHFLVKAVDVIADHLTVHCDPTDLDAPRDNGPAERAYWKRKVVESCIYGVDYNPMAVELARVALWLHTAEYGKPLSFLDHHLKVGNSLVGITLDRLAQPGLRPKAVRNTLTWELSQPQLSSTPVSPAPACVVGERLAAYRLLADLWCLQWFSGEPDPVSIEVYTDPAGLYEQLKAACELANDEERAAALAAVADHPLVRRLREARERGYGPRSEAFFHWQIEFPEVAFDELGQLRGGFGFDAVIGNPPWDRIRPERRHFYGPYGRPEDGPAWDVANTQGASLESLIRRLQEQNSGLADDWSAYEQGIGSLTAFLRDAAVYHHQVVELDGKKTGGDPDVFRYFVERSFQAVRPGGRVALVVPGALWQAEGCTGLRRLLLNDLTTEELFVFENYRKWAFDIDSRFKFTVVVAAASAPTIDHAFTAGFMLRDLRALQGRLPERLVRLTRQLVEALSPGTLALLDLQSDGDAQLVGRLHREHPALASAASGWEVKFRRELDMTTDAWRFKRPAWMAERGFLRVRPIRCADGIGTQERSGGSPTAQYPKNLPAGGEYWVAADAAWYRARGYLELANDTAPAFVEPRDAEEAPVRDVSARQRHRIVPGAVYTALYEGRMVHNFDHAQKGYVGGEGRVAEWRELPLQSKALQPRAFLHAETDPTQPAYRVGFCDVSGATNERSMLAALLPAGHAAGNKVPTLTTAGGDSAQGTLCLLGLVNAFVWDALLRLRVSTAMNWTYVARVPVPVLGGVDALRQALIHPTARLTCTTPELADAWSEVFPESPWTYESAERDPWKRGELRAEIDAIVADAYGLSVPEYARVLTGFPLLDRSQPSLLGDAFVSHADQAPRGACGVTWEETPFGIYERKPRSFITRDLALLAYMRRKKYAPPLRLDAFFRDEAGIDPAGPLSRFRIGEHRDLIDRVEIARKLGAVAYVPTGRGGGANVEEADDG